MKVGDYNADTDIPDLSGKVILVTGGTAGIGSESVLALAKHNPAHIHLSGRNVESAEAVIAKAKATSPDVPITFLQCDLSSLDSVKAAIESFKASNTRLDILMCNAGLLGPPPGLTPDGYELVFGTNHLGHALLIKLLLPIMNQTAELPDSDVRIVITASQAYFLAPKGGIVFSKLRTEQDTGMFGPWVRYGQSKLANLLYARELATRYPKILTMAIHPGIVNTRLTAQMSLPNRLIPRVGHPFSMLKPEHGAYNQLWGATAKRSTIQPGAYYEPVGVGGKGMKATENDELARDLWDWTEKALEEYRA